MIKQKPQTISTIDVNISFNSREQFLEEHAQCPLCGSDLLITQVTHFIKQSVTEEAHCEHCKVRTRKENHRLQ